MTHDDFDEFCEATGKPWHRIEQATIDELTKARLWLAAKP